MAPAVCPFCDPALWQRESIGIENDHCIFLTRPEPILVGSGLIITRRHCATVFELSADEWQATYDLLQRVKSYVDATLQPQGYNVGWNSGAAGGQEIFHVHLHIIPRFADEPLTGKGIRYWLKQEANRRFSKQ